MAGTIRRRVALGRRQFGWQPRRAARRARWRGPWSQWPIPDLEGLIRRAQMFIRNLLPGGRGVGVGGLTILVAVVVALWFASGFYRVQPDEQGIVLRFGAYKYGPHPACTGTSPGRSKRSSSPP